MAALKLTLACALTLLRLAHCPTTHSDNGTISQCNGVTLRFEFKQTNGNFQRRTVKTRGDIVFRYSKGDLKVTCSSTNATRLTLTKDKKVLQRKQFSDTIVMSILEAERAPGEYVCTDMDTHCNVSAFFTVLPTISINLANVSRNHSLLFYTIQYGNDLQVMCSYPSAARLALTKDGHALPTEKVNETTIMWFASKPDLQTSKFVCADFNTTENNSIVITVEPAIYLSTHEDITPSGFDSHDRMHKYEVIHDVHTEIFCSGPRAVKLIGLEESNKELLTEKVNQTTVKALIRNFKKKKSVFSCIDSEFPDYVSRVRIKVRPRVEVISPVFRRDGQHHIIKYDDPLEIICSGPDAAQLTIFHLNMNMNEIKEGIQMVNKTTIKASIKGLYPLPIYQQTACFIGHVKLVANRTRGLLIYAESSSKVSVGVLPSPSVEDFHCISYNLQYLNCSWIITDNFPSLPSNTLFSIDDGKLAPICAKGTSSYRYGANFCVFWYSTDSPGYPEHVTKFSFLMQYCYDFGCTNQTFYMDHVSIVKSDAPWGLRVLHVNSRGSLILWYNAWSNLAGKDFYSEDGDYHYKVQYWFSGIQPIEVNSTLVSCTRSGYCEIKLKLPCPAVLYKVWVYQKLKKAQYWSDPSTVTFYTSEENDSADIDNPTCNRKPRVTKEVMVYFVQNLRQEVYLSRRKLRKKIKSLWDKRARIREYLAQFNQKDNKY